MDQYSSTAGLSPIHEEIAGVRTRRKIYRLAIVFAVAFFIRLLLMVVATTYRFDSEWDFGFEYARIAKWILLGEGFSSPYYVTPRPSAMMAPAYVYFMALIFSMFGLYSVPSAIVIYIIQSLFGALTCLVFYHLGTKMFDEKVGLLAAIALALYPPAIFFSVMRVEPVVFIVFLLAWIIYYFLKISETDNYTLPVVCGLLIGITALIEPTVLSFFVLSYGWLWIYSRTPRRSTVKRLGIMGLVTVLSLLPWTIRNYAAFGTFVPIKSAFGLNLLEGNNPYGDGVMQYTKGFFSVEEREKIHRRPETPEQLKRKEMLSEAEREQKRRLNEVEADKLMFRKAMEFITAEPEKFLLFTMRRILAFWSPVNLYRTTSYDGLRALVYGVPLILGLAGIFMARSRWRETSLLVLLFLSYPLSYYVTHVSMYRYRYPVEPFLVLLACYVVVEVAKKIKRKALASKDQRQGLRLPSTSYPTGS